MWNQVVYASHKVHSFPTLKCSHILTKSTSFSTYRTFDILIRSSSGQWLNFDDEMREAESYAAILEREGNSSKTDQQSGCDNRAKLQTPSPTFTL